MNPPKIETINSLNLNQTGPFGFNKTLILTKIKTLCNKTFESYDTLLHIIYSMFHEHVCNYHTNLSL